MFESSKVILIETVATLMMSTKLATLGIPKITVFWIKCYDVITSIHDVTKKIISWLKLYCRCSHVTKVWYLQHFCKKRYHNLNFIRIWPEKPIILRGCSRLKFNNLGLALGMALKFTHVWQKGLKRKVKKFWGLIPTFAEVTGKIVWGERGGFFCFPPSWIGLKCF